jgi:simple sugar transport system permease protein
MAVNARLTWQRQARSLVADTPIAGPLFTLVSVFVLSALFVPHFGSWRTVSGIVNAATLDGIVTIGITLLMITGEFDLSVGSLIAVGGYLFGQQCARGNPLLGLVLAALVPGLLGALNGVIRVRTGIPSFIVTLGTGFIFRGFAWILSGGSMLQLTEKLPVYDLFNGRLDVLNDLLTGANFLTSLLWLLGGVAFFQYVLVRTRFGNHIFAVGGQVEAAAAQGVSVNFVRIATFAISGALGGLAGVLTFSQYQSIRVASGSGTEMYAIAEAVVGGALLTGGSGSIWGALIGVLLISMLRTAVVLLNIPFIPADNFVAIVGVTIVGAAIFNNWVRQRT